MDELTTKLIAYYYTQIEYNKSTVRKIEEVDERTSKAKEILLIIRPLKYDDGWQYLSRFEDELNDWVKHTFMVNPRVNDEFLYSMQKFINDRRRAGVNV